MCGRGLLIKFEGTTAMRRPWPSWSSPNSSPATVPQNTSLFISFIKSISSFINIFEKWELLFIILLFNITILWYTPLVFCSDFSIYLSLKLAIFLYIQQY